MVAEIPKTQRHKGAKQMREAKSTRERMRDFQVQHLHAVSSSPIIGSTLRLRASACNFAALSFLAMVCCSIAIASERDRSPVDLVLGPDGTWLATVNQSSDSISLVQISDSQVLDEIAVGHHPVGIALAPDGKTLLVSGHYSGDVSVLEVSSGKLLPRGRIEVGYQPHGIAIAPHGKTAYIAYRLD